MRRWNLLFVAALLAAVLITLSGPGAAIAAPASTTNFKGKAAVYFRNSDPYFVVNFTCTNNTLSGNWTFETSSGASYSGTLETLADDCALSGPIGGPWASSMDGIPLLYGGKPIGPNGATLNLDLSNISRTKTYVDNTTTCPGSTTNPCIEIQTTGLGSLAGSDFDSNPTPAPDPAPYGTLTMQLPKSTP